MPKYRIMIRNDQSGEVTAHLHEALLPQQAREALSHLGTILSIEDTALSPQSPQSIIQDIKNEPLIVIVHIIAWITITAGIICLFAGYPSWLQRIVSMMSLIFTGILILAVRSIMISGWTNVELNRLLLKKLDERDQSS